MAEEDAEIALLHSMQAGQESWDEGTPGAAEAEGEVPASTEDSDQQQVKEEPFADDNTGASHFAPSSSDSAMNATTGLSNPAIAAAINSNPESRSSSRASMRKPKTVGGFIADDSDEEDGPTPISAAIGLQPQAASGLSRSRSPLAAVEQQDTPDAGSSIQGYTDKPTNSPTVPIAGAVSDHVPQRPESVQVPVSATVSTSTQKARLPHDVAGKLEDRIKEDPRGDIDAWLSLVGEHRKRNKLEDARAVYERFFKVFPSAVSFRESSRDSV
jgi:cleavage stimulation factor subunit 3